MLTHADVCRNKLSAYTHQEMNVEEVSDAAHIARSPPLIEP
jgi:hypothetical protein